MITELRNCIEAMAVEETIGDDSLEPTTRVQRLAAMLWTHALGGIAQVEDKRLGRKVDQYVPPQKWAAELLMQLMEVVDNGEKQRGPGLGSGQVNDLQKQLNSLATNETESE